jgi:hypothetical protein
VISIRVQRVGRIDSACQAATLLQIVSPTQVFTEAMGLRHRFLVLQASTKYRSEVLYVRRVVVANT